MNVSDNQQNTRKSLFNGGKAAWLLLVLILLIPAAGWAVYQWRADALEKEAFRGLTGIATLKVNTLENWLAERRANGAVLKNDRTFLQHVQQWREAGYNAQNNSQREIMLTLSAYRHAYAYSSVSLLDVEGHVLWSSEKYVAFYRQTDKAIQQAIATQSIQHTGLISESHWSNLDFVVPLQDSKQQVLAIVVLRTVPQPFLAEVMKRWPFVTQTGEAFLVHRTGNEVHFLTEIRSQKNATLDFTLPLHRTDNATVNAVKQARAGTTTGLNYNGELVLAAFRPVASTDWIVVTQYHRDEVLGSLSNQILMACGTCILFLLLLSWLLWRLGRQQQHVELLQLQQERERLDKVFQYFFDLPFIGMAMTTPQNKKWHRFNNRLCDILGYSAEELRERTWLELTHPEDMEKSNVVFVQMMAGELDEAIMEKRYIRKDHQLVHCEVNIKCVRRENGEVECFCTTIQDITERKQMEQLVHGNATRLRAMIEAIPIPLLLSDAASNITYLNHSFLQLIGYNISDIPTWFDWWNMVCPDPMYRQKILADWQQLITRAQQQLHTEYLELEVRCKNGKMRTFLLNVSVLDKSLQDAHMLILIDVSESKEAEANLKKLSLAVAQSPSSIVITDVDAKIEYVNEAFVQRSGYTREEALGRNPRMLRSGKNSNATYQDMWEHLIRGDVWRGELINRRKDGKEYIESVIISPLREAGGRVTNYVAVKEDITKRKQAETELKEKLDELRRWHDASMGREMRIIELKNEVNDLLSRLKESPKYLNSEWMSQWDNAASADPGEKNG